MIDRQVSLRIALVLAAGILAAGVLATDAAARGAEVPSLEEFLTTHPASVGLEEGFARPPRAARLRCFWWWLNGNVTREAITRDLEAMKSHGYGGALIFDANGAGQWESSPIPPGPTFLSPQWRALFRHALGEARRLGLELGLNIQSGWNLGGPNVTPAMAAKKLVWSETTTEGPAPLERKLETPQHRDGYYRDVAVLACKRTAPPRGREASPFAGSKASSSQSKHPALLGADGRDATYWVSGGSKPGEGPTAEKPEWLQLEFSRPVAADRVRVLGRPRYGPRECELQVSEDGESFRKVLQFSVQDGKAAGKTFPAVEGRAFRLVLRSAYDPYHPEAARNVQVAELTISDGTHTWPAAPRRRPLRMLAIKTASREFGGSAPNCDVLLDDLPSVPGEEDARLSGTVNLTDRLDDQGVLHWKVPEGTWDIFRFGYTTTGARVSTSSAAWQGRVLDYLDPGAFDLYWKQVVEPLLADAGPLAGTALKYLHTDSWECGGANWSIGFEKEFRTRRGYDPIPYLPVIAGLILESRNVSNRFLRDLRRTIGDCILDNNYRLLAKRAHRKGLAIHPESGGPHGAPIDSLECLGNNDVPTSEFWARSYLHRVHEEDRFFVKQPASAAHTYGKRLVAAEGFTTIGPQWEETVWDNLKPTFDRALCEGLNLLFWHTFTCSVPEAGLPGHEYFAGCHFNPNSTWWKQSRPFLSYINRCQFLLQRGLFVADACYYYGDTVPSFTQLKKADPAGVLPGYDYDVATEEVLLTRMSVRGGRIVLPDGMSYRLLVLPDRRLMPLRVARKLAELVRAGATVIGPRPSETPGLGGYPRRDAELRRLAGDLWGPCDGKKIAEHRSGKGRIICGRTAREVLAADGVPPDFECLEAPEDLTVDFIHRRSGQTDIYFVSNQNARMVDLLCALRVRGRLPELWLPDTGRREAAEGSRALEDGRTAVPLRLDPYGSVFIVFRKAGTLEVADGKAAFPRAATAKPLSAQTIDGPWTVHFPSGWGAPESATFEKLISWTEHRLPGIRYFSGTAAYRKDIEIDGKLLGAGRRLVLDLGKLRELAQVRLGGADLGILWKPPFTVDITKAARPGKNRLEVRITNFWPNRIIGDTFLPAKERFTRHNIRKFTRKSPLMPSGLFGPVRILELDNATRRN